MIIMVAWRWLQHSPMLGQAASSQTVVRPMRAHQGAGLVIDGVGRRLYPDPRGLALDRMVRAVGLLRMTQRRGSAGRDHVGDGAVIDEDASGHGALQVAALPGAVKRAGE